jgi:DNA-binding NtrC family response regulator/tetratricopeptide (TPR) repeat protein
MGLRTGNVEALFRQGRYAQIVSEVDWTRLANVGPEERALIAHAAFQAGRIEAAIEVAKCENAIGAPAFVRAEAEAIFGLIAKRRGDWGLATKHFQTSLRLAKEARNGSQIGWASLRLFRTLAEAETPESLAALSNDVRQAVARAGDPHLSAYQHDSMALMEASAGRFEAARRHVQITLGILDRHPNAWIQQVASISSFFLDFLECRFVEALRHLRTAKDLCDLVGEGFLPVIECNEGHLLLAAGRYEAAEQRLRKVALSDSSQFAIGALDGLARLYLATGRLDECETALTTSECMPLEASGNATPIAGRGNAVTRVRLLQARGKHREAHEQAERFLVQVRKMNYESLVGELSFHKAEALAGDGAVREAVATLAPFATTEFVATPGQQASYYRALAVILAHAGSPLSQRAFARSTAIYHQQGNENGVREINNLENSFNELGRHRIGTGDSGGIDVANAVVNSLAAAVNLAHSKTLLARELLATLELLNCSSKAAIRHVRDDGVIPGVVGTQSVVLGKDRGKAVVLSCGTPADPRQAAAVSDILRIANAIVAFDNARQRERNRAAVWPNTFSEPVGGAVFIADEMQALLATARRVATTNVPVLITGETGTGKEILARTIHACSNRSKAAFLPFNCTSTPKDMLDSQLFGHRRGSFTGATDNFQGVIRAAAGGTLFLDEIGDMGLDVQPKLLRFLESGEVHPIGDTQPHQVDVRVIAATNANLDALVTDGRFREDLFYRLNIVPLHLPPLRERRVEIPAFANHYLQKYAQEFGKGDLRLAEETMEYLLLFRWPGNVRQLANEMRRMAALCEAGAVLMPEHLSPDIAASRRTIPASDRVIDQNEVVVRLDQPLAAATEHLERAMLEYALKQCGGRMEETAALLGLSRKGLYLKRQRFGIEPPEAGARAVDVA